MVELNEIESYIVNGYQFETKEDYEEAIREKKGIQYLNAQLDFNNGEKVLSIYMELIDKKIFITPIGIDYLKKLRNAILKSEIEPKEKLPAVYVPCSGKNHQEKIEKYVSQKYENDMKSMQKSLKKHSNRFKTSFLINIVLLGMVIVMFFITLTSSNINIINFETKLQDKYASWAEELKQKEQDLRELQIELESESQSMEINN